MEKRMNILKTVQEQIDNNNVISFDMFDTLVDRPFHKPSHVVKYLSINEDSRFNPIKRLIRLLSVGGGKGTR